MDVGRFNELVKARQRQAVEVLVEKGEEYAMGGDRLHNFKTAARMDNESSVRSLWGMWKKHIVSIRDEVQKMECDPHYVPSLRWVDEKLGDNINYTHLLEGLIAERREQLEVPKEDTRPAIPQWVLNHIRLVNGWLVVYGEDDATEIGRASNINKAVELVLAYAKALEEDWQACVGGDAADPAAYCDGDNIIDHHSV